MLTNQVVQLSATLEEVLTQVPTFAGRLADIEISNVEIFRHLFAMQNFIESGIISNDRLSVKLENIFPDNLFGDASIMDRFDGIKQANDEFALKLSTMHSSIDRAIQHTDELGVKLETSINADKPKNAAILSLLTKIEQSNEILISQMSSIHSQATRDDDWGLAIKNIIGNLVPPDPSRQSKIGLSDENDTSWIPLHEFRTDAVNTVPRAEFLDGNSVSSLPGRNYMLRE